MPEYPYYPTYPKDLNGDHKVMVMDNRTYGAYRRLLDIAWHEEPAATLPIDDTILAAYARESLVGWQEIAPLILNCFVKRGNRWWQKRLRSEWEKLKAIRDRQSEAGKQRWGNRSAISSPIWLEDARESGSGDDSGSSGVSAPWTPELWEKTRQSTGMAQKDAEECWAYYDSQGWVKSNGRAISGDPRSIQVNWMSNPKRTPQSPTISHRPGSIGHREGWKVKADIARETESRQKIWNRLRESVSRKRGGATNDEISKEWRVCGDPKDVELYDAKVKQIKQLEQELGNVG